MRRLLDLAISERVLMRALVAVAVCVALAGCAHNPPPPPQIVYQEVKVPVAVGCVRDRPERVKSLAEQITQTIWAGMPTGAKAQAVKAQAGRRQNYEDKLSASVAGCPDAPLDESVPAASSPGGKPATP